MPVSAGRCCLCWSSLPLYQVHLARACRARRPASRTPSPTRMLPTRVRLYLPHLLLQCVMHEMEHGQKPS
jgi:hypothetical protein